jgi:hypothetical protein
MGASGINSRAPATFNVAGNRVVSQTFALRLRPGRETPTTFSLLGRLSELEQAKGREWWPVLMTS